MTKLTLNIKNLSGKIIEIEIDDELTIKDVKNQIEEKEGIPWEQQRIVFEGKTMSDDKVLSDYKLINGSTLHLVLSLRGGKVF